MRKLIKRIKRYLSIRRVINFIADKFLIIYSIDALCIITGACLKNVAPKVSEFCYMINTVYIVIMIIAALLLVIYTNIDSKNNGGKKQ